MKETTSIMIHSISNNRNKYIEPKVIETYKGVIQLSKGNITKGFCRLHYFDGIKALYRGN